MAHVLIGFAEALPAPEVFFSLHDAGHEVSLFVRSGTRTPLTGLGPIRAVHDLPAPEQDAGAAVRSLQEILYGPDAPDLVLPIDDTALWLTSTALPEDLRVVGARGSSAALALDKTRQIAAARQAGFSVPSTWIVQQAEDLQAKLPFPAIAKPAHAIDMSDGHLIKPSVHYLPDQAAAKELAKHFEPTSPPLLVQPLITGYGEGIFGFAGPDGVCNWSGHLRVRMMNPHGSGSSACRANLPDPALRKAAENFIHETGWRGAFMIELLRDVEGTPWFMELNGRMWGSLALARDQGFEYPAWAVSQTLDPAFRPPNLEPASDRFEARHLGRDLLHLLFVLRGPKTAFYRDTWPGFLHSLRSVLTPQPGRRLYNEHPEFPGFARKEAFHTILKSVRGR